MEMGSSSLASSGACGSGDSLNGLKFGKKIYFEDLSGGGGGVAAAAGSSSRAPAPSTEEPAARKGKGVVHGGQQPPRCRVEGCKVDLTGAKAYYCRHKVCGMHSKAPKVVVAGLEQRFCQQCSRFHQLSEFDQGKRSCRRRLAGHNERRRKPPPGPLSRYARLPSFHEEGNRFRSFLMDFTHPRMPVASREVWPNVREGDRMAANQWNRNPDANQWNRNTDAPPGAAAVHDAHSHPYMQGPISVSEHPPDPSLAGVADSSCALSLLSTQPWGATASRSRAPTFSANSCYDGAPMAQPVVNSYGTNLWGYKGSGSSSENPHEMGLRHVTDGRGGDCQFSGELELALQGSRQCPDHAPSRPYHGMHWPL